MSVLTRLLRGRRPARPTTRACAACGDTVLDWVALMWQQEYATAGDEVEVVGTDELVLLCAACAPALRGPVGDAVRDVVGRHTTSGRGGSS